MGQGGRGGGITVTRTSDGQIQLSGRVGKKMREKLGDATADKLNKLAREGKKLNVGAVKAALTIKGAKGTPKVLADTIANFSQKGGAPVGTKLRVGLNSKGEVGTTMRDSSGKLKFKATVDELRKVTKLKNLVPKANKGENAGVSVANPLKSKANPITVGQAQASAAAGGKFGDNVPKIGDIKGNKAPNETAMNLVKSLQSTAQREISKQIADVAAKLGRDANLSKEAHAEAMGKAEKLSLASKEVKARLTGKEATLADKHAVRDQVRAEAIAALSANKDVGLAKQILSLKKEYETKGVMVLMTKTGTAATEGKRVGPDADTQYKSTTGAGAKLPPNTHYGYFQTANVGKTGDAAGKLNISITDETRRLTGEKSAAAATDNRFTTTRAENIDRMFVKNGNQWSEVTDKGLKPVKDVWKEIGAEAPKAE
jgi:hypothetical protein